MGYYHRCISKFAQVAWPLQELTLDENAGKKKAAIQWNSNCQQAFDDLKRLCATMPILAYADFSLPFKLHTDACGSGLGAILYQTHEDGTDAVIAYASRSLSKAESHYPAHKLEFLALKWAVVKKMHKYLATSTFYVYTHNNPLTYILTTAKLDAASHHWVASLANYNFHLYYWAGKTNVDADALSWVSWPRCMPNSSGTHLKVTAAAVWAVQETVLKGPASPIEAYSCVLHILNAVQDSQQVTCMPLEDWCQAQQVDPTLRLVISRLQDGNWGWWQSKLTNPPKFSLFLLEENNLVLKQGILYRWARPRESEETLFQLVLPATQREVALKGCHDQGGHLGLECMLDLMHDWFFWPYMAPQAKEHIRKCYSYLAFKARQPKTPLENVMATNPLELVHIDYLCLEPGKDLEENVLVVSDPF